MSSPPETRPADVARARPRHVLAVIAICFAVYLSNGRTLPHPRGGDTIPNRLIPFSILAYGTVELDAFRQDIDANTNFDPWYVKERKGALVSFYPVGTSVAAVPFYVPFYAWALATGDASHTALFRLSEVAEKLTAAAMTALAVGAFFLTARRRLSDRAAFWAALGFGCGTSMWATASQLLWQHTVVAAAVTVALWLLTWPGLPRRAVACAGLALSAAVAARPPAGLFFLAGLVSVFILARGRRLQSAMLFGLAGIPLVAFSLDVNYYYYGHLTGAYGKWVTTSYKGMFAWDRLDGIAGLLVSPNRGLFIFTPVAVLGAIGLVWQFLSRDGRDPVLLPFGIAALVHLVLSGTYFDWWGGWSFGPRYLTDVLPILALAAVTIWPRVPPWARRLTVFTLVLSVLAQFVGAFCYPASLWNGLVLNRYKEDAMWMWNRFELWEDFRHWVWLRTWAAPY